jgi:hypothetical protein
MAKNPIEESQQESQGITLGSQGHNDLGMTDGAKGSHQPKNGPEDRHIPNQDRSSASNMEKANQDSGKDQ